jgi:hypothetical protein
LYIFRQPGGIVSQAAYDKIQETANKLFEIKARVNFSNPVEEVHVIGQISNITTRCLGRRCRDYNHFLP